jgi:sugar phosphate isomerase/epimerase
MHRCSWTSTSTININALDDCALNKYIQLLRNRIEFCSAVGGDVVVIHPPKMEGNLKSASQIMERSTRVFENVKNLCDNLGIGIAVENCKPSDEQCLKYYFERYPKEFVGFCFDSGHANINKNLNQLLRFNNRLSSLHLHDNSGKEDDHQPPFFGTVDWRQVMGWIKSTCYSKPINFEIEYKTCFFGNSMNKFLEYSINSIQKAMSLY